ncbi:MAG: Crp/Fnr family transcriptional regulator [Alphaproteobacteria bacterium]
MGVENTRNLANIGLFEGLDGSSLGRIAQRCRWHNYGAQELIIDRESESRNVFFVASGKVRVVNYSLSGREIAFDEIDAGGFFGELSALDGLPRSATIVALEDTSVAALAPELFIELLAAHSQVALRVMRSLAHVVRTASERIMDLSTLGAHNRVQAELLRQARATAGRNQAEIRPVPVHGEIASRVSTTRETVARVFSDLTRQGLLKRQRETLLVLDLQRLEEMVDTFRSV